MQLNLIIILLLVTIVTGSLFVAYLYAKRFKNGFSLNGSRYYVDKSVRHYYRGTEYLIIRNSENKEFVISKNVLLKALEDER